MCDFALHVVCLSPTFDNLAQQKRALHGTVSESRYALFQVVCFGQWWEEYAVQSLTLYGLGRVNSFIIRLLGLLLLLSWHFGKLYK